MPSLYNDGTNADGRNAADSLADEFSPPAAESSPPLLSREEIEAVVELADEYTVNTLRASIAKERLDPKRWHHPSTRTLLIP